MDEQRWVFVVRSLDRPGALTSAASVFSNRGVSLEGVLGSGIDSNSTQDARLLISFQATAAKKEVLRRALERLRAVVTVDAYPYDAPNLRAIATTRLQNSALPLLQENVQEGVQSEIISTHEEESTVLLKGHTVAVEQLLGDLRNQNALVDVVMTAIAI
ncbi:MAG: hypothetical protein AAFY26_23215 [Cyanobacteria bacterium J06638_22]